MTIEAYGVRGMDNKLWRRRFASPSMMLEWAEQNDAEIHSTRDVLPDRPRIMHRLDIRVKNFVQTYGECTRTRIIDGCGGWQQVNLITHALERLVQGGHLRHVKHLHGGGYYVIN